MSAFSNPRFPLRNSDLTRPDWTKNTTRSHELLWLDKNENNDPILAQFIAKKFSEIPQKALSTYPECAQLYYQLAAHLHVDPNQLLLTHGSDGSIRSVFEAFINPGDKVMYVKPTFAMYPIYVLMYGACPIILEYYPSNQGPLLEVMRFVEAILYQRPKLICLPNPGSPTGTVFQPAELKILIETAAKVGSLILIDEAYYPFYPNSILPELDQYENLIIARTFAKAWGLAGFRIGYAVTTPTIALFLHKVRSMYEVNTLAVAMVEIMLNHYDHILTSVARLESGKNYCLKALENLGFRTLHGFGNFFHVAFEHHAKDIHQALANIVLYRKDFNDACLSGFSRFSSTTQSLFEPIIKVIEQVVTNA